MTSTTSTRVPFWRSLSGRLLLFTALFVLIGEVLIFVPSIARFRLVFLEERLDAGKLATLALEAAPDGHLDEALEQRLLAHAMVEVVVLRTPDRSMLMLSTKMPPPVDHTYDLRRAQAMDLIAAAFRVLIEGPSPVIRVLNRSRVEPGTVVEVVMTQHELYRAMVDFSGRILTLSIVLSLMVAGLVYLALHGLLVRPMRAITDNLIRFQGNPEDASTQIEETRRRDEVGVVHRTLAEMQRALRGSLLQKTRLAALGAAMGKINHDLRNTLASAMVVSDRLAESEDPTVRKVTPRLMAAIDRAVTLCRRTLDYAQSAEPELKPERLSLKKLVDDVGDIVAMDVGESALRWANQVPDGLEVVADHVQLFRVLQNIAQNSVEAMAGGGEVRIEGRRRAGRVEIDIADTGPGIPPRVREHLFQPFHGSARPGGSGLGLAIARENMRLHGGDIELVETGAAGTRFRLVLPDR
ncbi:MAG TPA: HAMP domain-containing sensor histidine kinase [Alphaproteobacteria bacterium]